MAIDTAWLKAHWYYVAGGLLGLFVLYEIISSLSSGSSAPASSGSADLSGGATQLQSLSAAADVTDAQYNAQVETAAYATQATNTQTAAALELGLAQTQAEEDVANNQTSAAVQLGTTQSNNAVETQDIVTSGQVQEAQIQGDTLTSLAKTAVSVPLAQIAAVNSQIQDIQTYSKNASKDYGAIAPVLAEETGQGGSVGAAKPTPTPSTAQTISSGVGALLGGLFGG